MGYLLEKVLKKKKRKRQNGVSSDCSSHSTEKALPVGGKKKDRTKHKCLLLNPNGSEKRLCTSFSIPPPSPSLATAPEVTLRSGVLYGYEVCPAFLYSTHPWRA
eukprot:TRINITY_DN5350_c0_g1_i1.p1 TRINITY_DN5350_c0_g1~~TRINITY_DN5350_c0_g1_i1.p1  ORF type:complete len:115 (+),score=15.45 TRINITY_DN5350_c0_g1_i1:34-345(+)